MTVIDSLPTSTRELADRYHKAWNDLDLEALVALMAPDVKFILRGGGGSRVWDGIDACRECFGFLLQAWPDTRMERTDLVVGEGYYVANQRFRGTLRLPWEMGETTYEPGDGSIEIEMVDIVHSENNLVKVKQTWIDGFAMAQQLQARR
jgi:SnoaL-like domain